MAEEIELKTAPADFGSPQQIKPDTASLATLNSTGAWWQKGEESGECEKFARYYRSLCPGEWVDKWNEQREAGNFPGPL